MKPALDRIRHSRLQHRTFRSRFGIQPLDELCALLALNALDSYCLICRRLCIGGFGMMQGRWVLSRAIYWLTQPLSHFISMMLRLLHLLNRLLQFRIFQFAL